MSCAATRQGDEFYCSRCGFRWDVDGPQPLPCAPSTSRHKDRAPATRGPFNAAEFARRNRGWVSSSAVLEQMAKVAKLAYEQGVKNAKKCPSP